MPDNHHHVTEGSKTVPLDIRGNILSKAQYKQLVSLLQLSKQSSTPQDLSAASANFAGLISVLILVIVYLILAISLK